MTKIEWTDAVWNPVTGCSKVSQGCRNCYAERMAKRFAGMNGYPADDPFKVTLHPDKLDLPLRWKKPRRIFVNSMSDLFHKDVPDEFIDRVFATMALCSHHTFQILTKRPERMAAYVNGMQRETIESYGETFIDIPRLQSAPDAWPLPNVWLGTSIEDQPTANRRIPELLKCQASVLFISAEPLLGPVDLTEVELPSRYNVTPTTPAYINALTRMDDDHLYNVHDALDWVIVGGESGPGARPMHPDWVRAIRDVCQVSGTPFLFKQHGEWLPADEHMRGMWPERANGKVIAREWWPRHDWEDGLPSFRVGRRRAGRRLDGRIWDEYPEVRHA